MVRPGRSSEKKKPSKIAAKVIDERPINRILPRSGERGNPDIPVRTVLYVEVQDHPAGDVQQILTAITKGLPNEHLHYCVPLRFGKLTTEFEFEGEFLETVKELCEIQDDEIVLKDGAKEVDVIRKKI
jgi:hypothetical protein